jgi:cyclic dehypoxanthinyl futalosine synthase
VICRLIRDAGFLPAQRNNAYNLLKVHDGPTSPDLMVKDWSELRAKPMHQEAPRGAGSSSASKTANAVPLTVTARTAAVGAHTAANSSITPPPVMPAKL